MRFTTTQPRLAVASGLSSSVGTTAGVDKAKADIWASSGSPGGSGGSRLSSSGGAAGGGGRTAGTGGGLPPTGGRPGSGRPGGSERSVSYQPEERYWTDYLRIAFPVLGLLLLLGLFWFWAMELIDNNDEPNGTTIAQQTQTVGTTPTDSGVAGGGPPLTEVADGTGNQTGGAAGTADTGEAAPRATRTPREVPPTEEPVGRFQEDDIVVTTEQANLRSEPAIGENVVTTLDAGTELTVTGPSEADEEDEERIWVPVVDNDDQEGYIAEELLELSE